MEAEEPEDKPKDKPKKDKKKRASRSIETMFRTTMSSHIKLSEMADRKAGLMISINSIVISIMTSFLVHEFATSPHLLVPSCVLLLVSLLTITFAVLATRPSVKPRANITELATASKIDLLFFGDYTSLSLENYKMALKETMGTDEQLYNMMIENIYAQGKVIDKKYKQLRISYTIFLYGFPIAMIGYMVAVYFA